jgi:hypothetical protein
MEINFYSQEHDRIREVTDRTKGIRKKRLYSLEPGAIVEVVRQGLTATFSRNQRSSNITKSAMQDIDHDSR